MLRLYYSDLIGLYLFLP